MKHLVLSSLLIAAITASTAVAASEKTMSVQVEESYLRASSSYFGTVTATVKYADRLTIIDTKGAWTKASFEGKTGWIHNSALTKKNLVLTSGKGVSESVSSGELSAAEKGFTKQIETSYREKNKNVDFTWVDKMEKIKVAPKVSKTFLTQGEVNPTEGGAK